jgi:antibiotic biosynthesis monooxygenase (ABM) superfamily enzyme
VLAEKQRLQSRPSALLTPRAAGRFDIFLLVFLSFYVLSLKLGSLMSSRFVWPVVLEDLFSEICLQMSLT